MNHKNRIASLNDYRLHVSNYFKRRNPNGLQMQFPVYHYFTESCSPNGLLFYVFKIIITLQRDNL